MRSRGDKVRRAPKGASAIKTTKAKGRLSSRELLMQMEHISLNSFLSDRHPTAPASSHTPFKEGGWVATASTRPRCRRRFLSCCCLCPHHPVVVPPLGIVGGHRHDHGGE
jgi:hypothetical protein